MLLSETQVNTDRFHDYIARQCHLHETHTCNNPSEHAQRIYTPYGTQEIRKTLRAVFLGSLPVARGCQLLRSSHVLLSVPPNVGACPREINTVYLIVKT